MKTLSDALPTRPNATPQRDKSRAVAVCDMAVPQAMPTMSPALAQAVAAEVAARTGWAPTPVKPNSEPWQNANHDYGHRSTAVVSIPAHLQPEARRVADAAARALQPIGPEALARWLATVNGACEYPLPMAEFEARCRNIAEIMGDIPAAAFTDDARRTLATTVSRFPSAKQISDAVKPEAQRLAGKLDALRRLAARPPAAEPAPVAAPVCATRKAMEDAGNSKLVASLKVMVAASERGARSAAPAYATTEQRIAAYRAIGQNDVADRIAAAYGIAP